MSVVTVLPRDGNWTVEHLDEIPADGLQYELVDGILLVSPAPVPVHQRAARGIFKLLDGLCPDDSEVFFAPVDFRPHRRTSVQPDVLVVRRADVGEKNLTLPFLLAVEVLSPSTRRKDLVLKHSVYGDAGVASYWTIDPREPSIVCWDLVDGGYVEAGRATRGETLTVYRPFPATLCPAEVVRG